jgi:D-sedoheptulose 7-phosphate isomerase
MKINFEHIKDAHQQAIDSVFFQKDKLEKVVEIVTTSINKGGKVIWCGNGGSAAEAQHMAAELMVRYVKNRQPLASIALTTDCSIITAHTNDFDYESVFSRQLEGIGREGDVLIAMSTSGNSANVLKALEQAKKMGIITVALTGQNTKHFDKLVEYCFSVNSYETARIQEAHTLIGHLLCEGLDLVYGEPL